ncbi:MAG TPA: DUF3015 domain-containing protein [Elusimicrobiota bacterium]|nr:DUF3015 domain-containing protein [Elusimicrobiota bacterium]
MRKLIACALAVALFPTALMAAGNHPMAGCGLAYILFSKDNNSKAIQILASTTNNLYGTQTFGITSGTSGCTENGTVKFGKEAELYAEINLKELTRDMARGEGEYLGTFAGLLGVQDARRAEFFQLTQQKYGSLVPSAETSSTEMLNALSKEMASHPELLG